MSLPKNKKKIVKRGKNTKSKKTANFINFTKSGPGSQKELYDNIGHEYAPGRMGPPVYTKPIGIRNTGTIKLGAKKRRAKPKTKVG